VNNGIECHGCDAIHEGDISDDELLTDDGWGFMMGKKPYSEWLDEPYYACPDCKTE